MGSEKQGLECSSVGRALDQKVGCNTDADWSDSPARQGIFLSSLRVNFQCRLLQCLHSLQCMYICDLNLRIVLSIPSAGSHTVVWTHKNIAHVVMNGTRNILSWTVHGTCCHAVVAAVASPNLNFPQTLNKVCAYLLTELSSLKLQQAFSHEYSTNIIQDNTMPERQTFSYSSSLKKIVVTDRLSFFIFCLCVGGIFFNLNIDFAVILLLVVSAKTVDIAVITLAKSKELSLGDNTMHSLCIVCIRESNVCKGFTMFLIYERKFLLWNWLT